MASGMLAIAEEAGVDTIALSGGVMQNDLLLADIGDELRSAAVHLWTNRSVPPNDGGVNLGQAALALVGARRA
jgi:hydrogenase maturation protein HypF